MDSTAKTSFEDTFCVRSLSLDLSKDASMNFSIFDFTFGSEYTVYDIEYCQREKESFRTELCFCDNCLIWFSSHFYLNQM